MQIRKEKLTCWSTYQAATSKEVTRTKLEATRGEKGIQFLSGFDFLICLDSIILFRVSYIYK